MSVDVMYDNLDSTGGPPIIVEAEITLLPPSEGGKTRAISRGYRPNHNFGAAGNRIMYIGQVELEKGELLHPGDSRKLRVTFLNVRGLADLLQPGTVWRLQEGTRLVGTGKVLRVVTPLRPV